MFLLVSIMLLKSNISLKLTLTTRKQIVYLYIRMHVLQVTTDIISVQLPRKRRVPTDNCFNQNMTISGNIF